MQDAAGEVELRDEEGGIRSDFLHAVVVALDDERCGQGARAHHAAARGRPRRPDSAASPRAARSFDLDPWRRLQARRIARTRRVGAGPGDRGDAHRAGGRGDPAARLRRCGLSDRGPRQGRPVGHSRRSSRRSSARRSSGASNIPRIPPAASCRRISIAVPPFWTVGQTIDLHARGRRPARPVLRSVRRRSRLPPDRLGRAQPAAAHQAHGDGRDHHRHGTSIRSLAKPTRRRWRASSSATI